MKNIFKRTAIVLPALLLGSVATLGMYAHASSTTPATTAGVQQPITAMVSGGESSDGTPASAKDTDNLQVQDGPQNGADGEQVDGIDVGHVDAGQSGGVETPDAHETGSGTESGN